MMAARMEYDVDIAVDRARGLQAAVAAAIGKAFLSIQACMQNPDVMWEIIGDLMISLTFFLPCLSTGIHCRPSC